MPRNRAGGRSLSKFGVVSRGTSRDPVCWGKDGSGLLYRPCGKGLTER